MGEALLGLEIADELAAATLGEFGLGELQLGGGEFGLQLGGGGLFAHDEDLTVCEGGQGGEEQCRESPVGVRSMSPGVRTKCHRAPLILKRLLLMRAFDKGRDKVLTNQCR